MPLGWVAGAIAVGAAANVYSSGVQADAAKSAANTQANAALAQQGNLLAAGQQASQQFTPYSAAGTTALSNLANNNAYFNHQFNNQDLNANLAPNYAFQLQQGQLGNEQANNATGGIVGGNAQQALNQFTQGYAGTAYQNAFNNYQTQRGNINAMNMNEAQLGLAGATGSANAQIGTATNVANLGIGAANAQAAGQIGAANAYASGANNLSNLGLYGANQYNAANNANLNNQNLGGYTPSEIAQGASPGGAFTPTAGNSFTITPA